MVLYASLLDGFLRIGLVLKRQLKRKTSEIDQDLIRQTKGGTFFTERQIYRMALQEGVIDEALFKALASLYDRRNEIVHKFFLTSIVYESLADDLPKYEELFEKLHAIVWSLEKDQIDRGVGMTVSGRHGDPNEVFRYVDEKISSTPRSHSASK